MGVLTDSVEAEFNGRHYGVRASLSLFGASGALSVDGRRFDAGTCPLWRTTRFQALVDGELVLAEVRVGLLGVRYRLFVGEVEVPLHVEPGTSSFSVELPAPQLAFARHQQRRLR